MPRPRTADDKSGDHEELTQDNHIADQYEEPQYQDPIEPPVVDGDEPALQQENEEPVPPPANPKRGTKRKKASEKSSQTS